MTLNRFNAWLLKWEPALTDDSPLGLEHQKAVLGYLLTGTGYKDPEAVRQMMMVADHNEELFHVEVRSFALDRLVHHMFYKKLKDEDDPESSLPYRWEVTARKDERFVPDFLEFLRGHLEVSESAGTRVALLLALMESNLAGESDLSSFFELALRFEFGGRLLTNVAPTNENIAVLTAIATSGRDGKQQLGHLYQAAELLDYRAFAATLVLKLLAQQSENRRKASFGNNAAQLEALGRSGSVKGDSTTPAR